MTTKTQDARPAGPALEEAMTMNMDSVMETLNINWTAMLTKMAIGYVYFVLGFIAFDHVAYMLMMLTSVAWLQYIIAFAVLCVGIYVLIKTAPVVANATYKGLDYAFNKAKSLFGSAKEKVSNFEMPKFGTKNEATVH